MKKDIHWSILETDYIVRNVPYEIYDAEGEVFFDLGVSIKLTAIRDLMVMNELPHDLDYDVFKDVEF